MQCSRNNNKFLKAIEILLIFFRLGLTSFGGPVAHLGYFREEFVERRKWLSEHSYVDLVALCQILPGPASSKVGIAWINAIYNIADFSLAIIPPP